MTPRAINATIAAVQTLAISLPVRRELVVSGAGGTHDHSDFLLVRVLTSAGVEGIGEVSATLIWSGEDAGTAEHVIRNALAPAILGRPLTPVADLEARMDKAVAASQFTKAGVSTALWDAYARTLDVPLAVALGGPLRTSVPVKFSLSGDGDRLRTTYQTAFDLGFRAFKVKIGLDPVTDAARFATARQLVGADTFLGTDANGGYSRREAHRAIELIRPHGPEFLEQWLAPGDLTGLRQMREAGVPVVADESVFTLADLVAAVRAEAVDVVSLYVGKSGGPARAVRMASVADAFGLEILLGSNGEQGIGAAAQLHVACASPGLSSAIPSDIIGAHYYDEDILAAPLPGDGRWVHLPDGPGLGVTLRADLAAQFR
ncbi:mandelate racemase/muconate lactonizing enzyme family protein [Dactylosporangium sucinum]|uniref:Chloromuconate cycloisomerase n=1 Tax=Dactylosporangium sucinum TaxID=1424081 RepID=A0A917X3S2_9ACTN|nr:enolase C-terminal domain-like protein [Dactylosporangium sucinum]GGM61841.1 chloromuconate cycloisomerase [Dactylosporangium sucinum]